MKVLEGAIIGGHPGCGFPRGLSTTLWTTWKFSTEPDDEQVVENLEVIHRLIVDRPGSYPHVDKFSTVVGYLKNFFYYMKVFTLQIHLYMI